MRHRWADPFWRGNESIKWWKWPVRWVWRFYVWAEAQNAKAEMAAHEDAQRYWDDLW